jgi:hypothetical protein
LGGRHPVLSLNRAMVSRYESLEHTQIAQVWRRKPIIYNMGNWRLNNNHQIKKNRQSPGYRL